MDRVEIRNATAIDLDAILDLFDLVAEERLWIGTEPGYDRALKRARMEASLANPERTPSWIACDGPQLVGHLAVFTHAEAGPTIGMMLRPEYRRKGIGRALLERCFTWARERAVPSLALHVFPHNDAALALYRSTGFIEIERYEGDVTRVTGDVWDTILMRKYL